MITPRRTRLFRVPDLAAFRTTLAGWILALSPTDAGETFVLVPTRAAAEQLRRSTEARAAATGCRAVAWPIVAPRRELYEQLVARMDEPGALASVFEREVMLAAVARRVVDDGLTPPFPIRPGLIAEMLALYDHVRRLGRGIDDFERNLRDELEREQAFDRGAAQLLQQTLFLGAVFRGYEAALAATDLRDEHVARAQLLAAPARRPLRRVVITVADRVADPDGFWPADLDLLSRLPHLGHLDVVSTEQMLASGFLERLHAALPELDDQRSPLAPRPAPVLVAPATASSLDPTAEAPILAMSRDREDELAAVARRVKRDARASPPPVLHRTAVVVRRPLPYLYLARDVFADAGIPFEALDTLPLAAEPYAAAVDLALEAVASDFTRTSLLALLRSPHFRLRDSIGGGVPDAAAGAPGDGARLSVAACDAALAEARYLGGLAQLDDLVARWQAMAAPATREQRRQQSAVPAATVVLAAARELQPLAEPRRLADQIATLVGWLRHYDRPSTDARRLRVRGAVIGALAALRHAYERHDPSATGDVAALTAAIRRWLGSQTFATATGTAGLQVVDAQAARYGDYDDIQIAGLVDGEWPDRVRRNVLYPSSLLALLEPMPADPRRRERDALSSARAAFRDLVGSAAERIRLSSFALENDAVVEPSILLDEVASLGLRVERRDALPARVSFAEALSLEPRRPDAVPEPAASWARVRLAPDSRPPDVFRGAAGPWQLPRVSVSRIERYLDCPFRFYASEVLRLAEEPDDEDTRTPLERGRFLHELWERFFAAWQRRGHGRVEPAQLAEARALFQELCETALATLPAPEAALERARLLGSAVGPGIAHRVFAMEANRAAPIAERLLEFPLQGDFAFSRLDGTTRTVTLSAKVDRIDRLADGTIRIIDYKSKQTPDVRQALQLPIYSFVARDTLRSSGGAAPAIAEALYLSFEGDKAVVPLRARGATLDELLAAAQDRFVGALDDIAAGRFPPRPARRALCGPCPYRAVCRLEIVEPAAEVEEAGGD